MEPASSVIEKLGGVAAVAKHLGLSTKQIHCWTYPRARGGTHGMIPARHQANLLTLAKQRGVKLAASELIQEAA